MSNLVWGQVITMPTNMALHFVYKSTVKNIGAVRNFEVMSD